MSSMFHFVLGLLLLSFMPISAQQIVLKKDALIDGSKYFITLEKYNGKSEIWARHKLMSSHYLDVKIVDLATQVSRKDEAMELICRSKKVLDAGKTIAGCTATIGSAVCIASAGGAGIGVPVCTAVITYSATAGFVDCVSGLTSLISRYFGKADFGYAVEMSAGSLSYTSLVYAAIDAACSDWKSNK